MLGSAFSACKPDDVTLVNVSRRGTVRGDNVINYQADVLRDPEKLLRRMKTDVLSIDVFITMAYDRRFSSIEKMNRKRFLGEVELDVFSPLRMSVLCGAYFWSKDDRTTNMQRGRKVIHISSGAAFGKTSRPELASYSGAKAALTVMTEYLHDYLFSSFGVSAHVVAPGSLQNPQVKEHTVSALWELQGASLDQFTVRKIFE